MRRFKVALSSGIQEFSQSEFERFFDITYLPFLEYADWQAEQYLKKRCKMALKKGKISQLCLWLGKFHGNDLEKGDVADVFFKWIDDLKGYGTFADRDFKPWEFIGEYVGIVRRRRLIFPDVNDYCFMYPRKWLTLKPYTIDSEKEGNFTRFINHSDYPNLESLAVYHNGFMHILFRTIKHIKKGEELSYDYGDVYWNKRKKMEESKPL